MKLYGLWQKDGCSIFLTGLLFLTLASIYYVSMGENAVVLAHDQLDQMYTPLWVEHFGEEIAPEFMYGVETSGLLTTPLGFALLYFVLPPVYAYLTSYAIILIVAYVGMVTLCRVVYVRMSVSVIAGIFFAALPFYCTYGLAMMGLPLIVALYLIFWRGPSAKRLCLLVVCALIFPFCAGLTLTGFILAILAGGVHPLWRGICEKQEPR